MGFSCTMLCPLIYRYIFIAGTGHFGRISALMLMCLTLQVIGCYVAAYITKTTCDWHWCLSLWLSHSGCILLISPQLHPGSFAVCPDLDFLVVKVPKVETNIINTVYKYYFHYFLTVCLQQSLFFFYFSPFMEQKTSVRHCNNHML